jgi:undecaprenyl diphosphate synthase
MTDDSVKRGTGIHIGLIPDGNRRYARKSGKPEWKGHIEGAKKIREFMDWCLEYPEIKRVSVFGLSSDNLTRSKKEVKELWSVYKKSFKKLLKDPAIKENRIRVRIVGDDKTWDPDLKDIVKEVAESTKQYSRYVLNFLLAYGSKFEITDAVRKIAKRPISAIDRFLMVKEPLDLIIRTGDQYRLSNFMLYQAGYAEIYFSKTMWPDFTKEEFRKIMKWYYKQRRKFGK